MCLVCMQLTMLHVFDMHAAAHSSSVTFLGHTNAITVQNALRRVIAVDCMVMPCTWGWQ